MLQPRVCVALLTVLLIPVLGGCRCEGDPGPDAGEPDAGELDAGFPDAGDEPDAGAPDAGEPDAGGTDGGPQQYCPALARARCERELSCGFLGSAELSTCLTRLALECKDDFRREDAGAARFDPASARRCVASVAAVRCAEGPLTVPAVCAFHQVFDPAAQLGTNCVDSQDCVAGFCFGTTFECRVCRAFAALSQPCSPTNLRCDPDVHFCALGLPRTCAVLLADGAGCGSSSECAARWCNWSSQVPDAGPDLCGQLPLGAGCGDPGDCAGAAWCQGYVFEGASVTAGVCAPRLALGASCSNTPDDDGCEETTSCLEGRCAVAPPYSLDAGSECERLSQCQEALYCRDLEALQPDGGRSLRAGVCTPRLLEGAPCSYATYVDTDCSPSTTCGQNATCVPRGPSDAGCQARYECQDFLSCPGSSQRCTPFSAAGEACEVTGSVCLDSWCGAPSADAGLSCLPALQDGATCSALAPAQCASARCFSAGAGTPSCQPACFP